MLDLNPLNQFSFLIVAGVALLGLAAWFVYTGFTRRKVVAWAVMAAAFAASWLSLRTGPSAYTDAAQAELVIRTAQRPLLVEFYSDYCAACLAARPALDTLERDLQDELTVLRLDVASPAGQQLGGQLDLRATPTFILFDANGQELWRAMGSLDVTIVKDRLGRS